VNCDAEEILHTSKAHWLSDDNRFLAYIQFDDRHVPLEKFPLYNDAANMYSSFMQVPYPKVDTLASIAYTYTVLERAHSLL